MDADEIERRRQISIAAMKAREREEWQRQYQETCDREYWRIGQCCSGCDRWQSDSGLSGVCTAAGIVSGEQVMLSIGVTFSSYTPPPGFPYTRHDFHCGLFRDDFDWSTLPEEYLRKIGAWQNGAVKQKPHGAARPHAPLRG